MERRSIFKVDMQMAAATGLALLLAGAGGCAKFDNLKLASYVTLKKDIVGDFCVDPGRRVEMPVKILLVIDVSASNGGTGVFGTDTVVQIPGPNYGTTKRLRGYRELIESLVPTPAGYDPDLPSNYHFGLITFNGSAHVLTEIDNKGFFYHPLWQGDSAWQSLKAVEMGGPEGLTAGTGTTNYSDAFSAIVDFIRADLDRTSADQAYLVDRTTYKIIFVTDGIPDDGTIGEGNLEDPNRFHPDPVFFPGTPPLVGCIPNPYSSGGTYYCPCGFAANDTVPYGYYPNGLFHTVGMACVGKYGDYLFDVVYDRSEDSVSVLNVIERTRSTDRYWRFHKETEDGVVHIPLEVSWNTIFYNDEAGDNPDLKARQYSARTILSDIASIGKGKFVDLTGESEISFIDNIPLNPALRRYELHGFFVRNRNAVILNDKDVAPDSDADGLHDDLEIELGTDPLNEDTDGDGLRDGFEHFKTGFDPLVDDALCGGAVDDNDHDGLNRCEEVHAMTDEALFDTDRDGIPDGLEIIFGLNPKRYDRDDDNDFDGINNYNEVVMHRNPNVPNDDKIKTSENSFVFKIDAYLNEDLINCYHIELRNVEIVQTLTRQNEIEILAISVPEDNPKEKGIFSRGTVTIQFDDTRNGVDSNTIRLEDIQFTTYR